MEQNIVIYVAWLSTLEMSLEATTSMRREMKAKTNGAVKLKSFYTMKENISRKKDSWGEEQKKIACWMGEDLCISHILQGVDVQNT